MSALSRGASTLVVLARALHGGRRVAGRHLLECVGVNRVERLDRRAERAALTSKRLRLLGQLAGGPLAYVRGALGIVYDPRTDRVILTTGKFW